MTTARAPLPRLDPLIVDADALRRIVNELAAWHRLARLAEDDTDYAAAVTLAESLVRSIGPEIDAINVRMGGIASGAFDEVSQ